MVTRVPWAQELTGLGADVVVQAAQHQAGWTLLPSLCLDSWGGIDI